MSCGSTFCIPANNLKVASTSFPDLSWSWHGPLALLTEKHGGGNDGASTANFCNWMIGCSPTLAYRGPM